MALKKQLYCPYNTKPDGDYGPAAEDETRRGFYDEIKKFHDRLAGLHIANPQKVDDGPNFNPSNKANI